MPNTVYNLLLVLAYLRKSSRTFFVRNYLLNYLLETRNKPYTTTLAIIKKMTKYIQIFIILFTLSASGQNVIEMKTPQNTPEKFTEFITKEKFVKENFYPGIVDEKMRPIFTKKINLIATDFKTVSESEKPTDKKYQEKIEIGLSRFSDVYIELDTEDREQICTYLEQLMDIVELESSNGQLNKFMYGFDPNELIKEK
jgi:hypothetical protein